jgi:hypothetical protein
MGWTAVKLCNVTSKPWETTVVTHPTNNPTGTVVYRGISDSEKTLTEVLSLLLAANRNFHRHVQEIKLDKRR